MKGGFTAAKIRPKAKGGPHHFLRRVRTLSQKTKGDVFASPLRTVEGLASASSSKPSSPSLQPFWLPLFSILPFIATLTSSRFVFCIESMKKIVKQKNMRRAARAGEVQTFATLRKPPRWHRTSRSLPVISGAMRKSRMNTGYFIMRRTAPLSESCHAWAIIPGRRLFLHHASNPNINP